MIPALIVCHGKLGEAYLEALAGIYGEPTGKPVRIMGISHLHVKDGKFVAEWTLIDELAVRVDLYTPDS